jgi:hypothetical protein
LVAVPCIIKQRFALDVMLTMSSTIRLWVHSTPNIMTPVFSIGCNGNNISAIWLCRASLHYNPRVLLWMAWCSTEQDWITNTGSP